MKGFLALPPEKQQSILEAGYLCFGQMGYKKASVADIAGKAGISKAMIFHYFGSKRGMYLALIEHGRYYMAQNEPSSTNFEDYFQRVVSYAQSRLHLLEQYPAMLVFVQSVCREADPEVQGEIQKLQEEQKATTLRQISFTETEARKFKDTVNLNLVTALLLNYMGYVVQSPAAHSPEELHSSFEQWLACVAMLREHLYKEEYL